MQHLHLTGTISCHLILMRTSAVAHSTVEVAAHILATSHLLATEEAARHILAVEVLTQ